ncbi:MAG: hypothetical protein AAF108_02790 [Planctomycetota bacterium]
MSELVRGGQGRSGDAVTSVAYWACSVCVAGTLICASSVAFDHVLKGKKENEMVTEKVVTGGEVRAIQPLSVGRIVNVKSTKQSDPLAAIVTKVHAGMCADLEVFVSGTDEAERIRCKLTPKHRSVRLISCVLTDEVDGGGHEVWCSWPERVPPATTETAMADPVATTSHAGRPDAGGIAETVAAVEGGNLAEGITIPATGKLDAGDQQAVAVADQENARARDERQSSPDGMTASERAMSESSPEAAAARRREQDGESDPVAEVAADAADQQASETK